MLFIVLSSSTDGMLRIVTQDPLTMITGSVSYSSQTNAIYPNRTAVNTGANITLSFTSGHIGDDMNSYTTPTAVWLKDGTLARTTPTNMAVGGNGRLNSTLSFTFQASDAGVYQCVFSGSGSQVYGTTPLRLDTGMHVTSQGQERDIIFLPSNMCHDLLPFFHDLHRYEMFINALQNINSLHYL